MSPLSLLLEHDTSLTRLWLGLSRRCSGHLTLAVPSKRHDHEELESASRGVPRDWIKAALIQTRNT